PAPPVARLLCRPPCTKDGIPDRPTGAGTSPSPYEESFAVPAGAWIGARVSARRHEIVTLIPQEAPGFSLGYMTRAGFDNDHDDQQTHNDRGADRVLRLARLAAGHGRRRLRDHATTTDSGRVPRPARPV